MTFDQQQTDRLLAEALPEGIVILDRQGKLIWWSKAAAELMSLNDEVTQGKHIDRVMHKKLFHTLQSRSDVQIRSPNHPDLFLSLHLCPYWGDQWLLILEDITLTYRLESMRRDFIANVSHELRTPLTVFHGYLELLKGSVQDLSSNQLQEIVDQMEGQANRMMQLVEDLLLLSRLESAEPDIESHQKVSVASVLQNICEDAKTLSGHKQHHFILELDDQLTLEGAPEELRSAFSNLIYNAVHYTPDQGTITVRWYITPEGAKHMEVEDTGIGIPAKHIPRLTQRFYRVDKARSSKGGGTGLGLAIVKHVLLRHNAELYVESKVGKGSLFRCIFL